eukprot:gene7-9604_t
MATSDEESVLLEYKSSLSDLDFNSKPMINMLTMLAEENVSHASGIVSIIKRRIIEGDERVRISLYKLRNTWRDFFTKEFLYELDLAVKNLDQNWPVVDVPPPSSSIHINPRFLVKNERGPSIEYDLQHGNTNSIGHAERNISTQQQETKDQPLVGDKVSQSSAKYSKVPRSTDPRRKDPPAKDPPAKDLLQSDSNFVDGSTARGNQHEVMHRKKKRDELLLTGSKTAKEVLPKGSPVSNVKRQRTTQLSSEVTEKNVSPANAGTNDIILSSVSNIDSSVTYRGEAADNLSNSGIQLQSNITKASKGEWFPPNKKVKIVGHQRVSSNGSDCTNEIGNLDGNVSKKVREATAEMSEKQNTTGGHLAKHNFPSEADHHRNGSNMKRKSNLDDGQRVPSEDELPRQMRIKNHQKLLDELRKRLDIGEITKDAHDALLGQINMMYQVQKRRDSTGEKPHGERVGEANPSVSPFVGGSLKEASPGQKSLEQEKTNRDLIAQLKEKRLNAVKELAENSTKIEPLVSLKQDSKMITPEKISELPDVTSGSNSRKSNTNERTSQASTHKPNFNIEAIEKTDRLVAEPCSKPLIATEEPCSSQQVTNLDKSRDSNFDVLGNKLEVHGRAFKTERKVNKRNAFNFHKPKNNSVNTEREDVQHNKLLHKKGREGFGIRHQGSRGSPVNFNEMVVSQPSSDPDVESRAKNRHENLYWGDEVSKGPSNANFAPRNSCEWQRAPFENRRQIGPRPSVQLFEQKPHYDNSRRHREQETFIREDRFRRDNFRERNQAENDGFFVDEVRSISEKVQGRFVAPEASRHQQSQFKGFARGGRQRFVHKVPSSPYFRPNTQDNRMLPDSFQDQPFRRNLPDFDAPGRNMEDSWVMDSKFDNKRVVGPSGAAGPNIGDGHPHRRQMLGSRRDVEASRHVDFIRHEEAFRQSRADNIAHHPFREEERFIYNNESGFFKSAQPVPENMSMKPDWQTQSVETHREQLPFRSLLSDESTSPGISADQRLRYFNSNEDGKRNLEENDNIRSRTRQQMSLFEKNANTDKSNVAEEFEQRTGLDNSSRYKTFNTSDTKADDEIPSEKRKFIGVRELFQRLVSSGVIANSSKQVEEKSASTPPPALESEEAIIPNLRFVMEDLKT